MFGLDCILQDRRVGQVQFYSLTSDIGDTLRKGHNV